MGKLNEVLRTAETKPQNQKRKMEFTWSNTSLVWSAVTVLSAALLLLLLSKSRNNNKKRPPGPPRLPLFGNMFDLGTIPHQTMYKLGLNYGPVLWLQLGSMNTMVIQSAKAATELFKNHDLAFCDRKVPDALTAFNFTGQSLGVNRYGPYWRVLRRLYSMEILVNKRINDMAPLRRKWVDKMIGWIEEDSAASRAKGESGQVNLPHFLFLMAFNMIGDLMLSRELLDFHSKEGHEFFDAMNQLLVLAVKPNMSDFFPFLTRLDPQGIKKSMEQCMGRAMNIVSGFMKERVQGQQVRKDKVKDFLDSLLEYKGDGKEGPDKLSNSGIHIVILEMFLAGSETTSTAIEWAMAELLRSPESMRKAKEELDRVVGQNRKIEESDIDELPYLQAVVKEALRLHPPLPLLLPRNTQEDTNFMGYHIPKNTQVLVNAWAIGRDQDSWEDPLSFKPERFLGSNIDYKGQNFELIPFGSGRRICVGISLAHRVVHFSLASLIHSFDWELGSNVTPETLDMSERVGLTVRKLEHLKAIPKKRIIKE